MTGSFIDPWSHVWLAFLSSASIRSTSYEPLTQRYSTPQCNTEARGTIPGSCSKAKPIFDPPFLSVSGPPQVSDRIKPTPPPRRRRMKGFIRTSGRITFLVPFYIGGSSLRGPFGCITEVVISHLLRFVSSRKVPGLFEGHLELLKRCQRGEPARPLGALRGDGEGLDRGQHQRGGSSCGSNELARAAPLGWSIFVLALQM